MRPLALILLVTLSGCIRNQPQSPTWDEEDKSIRFPNFHNRFAVMVGKESSIYDMDGETLRAINVAAADFIPPESKERPCWETREAHRYRVIRQGELIFVRISLDHDYCTMGFGMLDYGVTYAISTDGRILRRLYPGEPEDPFAPPPVDAGPRGPEFWVDPSKVGDTSNLPIDCDFVRMMERSTGRKLSTRSEECQVDAGTPHEPSPVDGGEPRTPTPVDAGKPPPPPVTDGGTPPP